MHSPRHPNRLHRAAWLLLAALALAAAGCGLGGGEPPLMIKQWTLEYPPPSPLPPSPSSAGRRLPAALKVKRFGAVRALIGTDMLYRPRPNQREAYNYHRWLVSPADMVGDFLLRDLRAQAAFAAVFSSRQPQRARFVVEGGVEEFMEVDGEDGWQAVLRVNLALVDTKQDAAPRRLLFQRDYRFSAPMPSRDAAGLARGMSKAMEAFSQKARADLVEAVRRALEQGPAQAGD